jgi:hypothetical protein
MLDDVTDKILEQLNAIVPPEEGMEPEVEPIPAPDY